MCEKLMNNPEQFESNFLDIMVSLADDKVVNVKLVLAETVKKHWTKKGHLCSHDKFMALKKKLASDEDEEVRSVFEDL
jgi:hypothetical protein